jgi:acetyl-CoA acetyltransferase
VTTDIAIVGVGLHEFGRTPDVSGLEQGAVAVRRALADADCRWEDVEYAYGGSLAAGSADTLVNLIGLTGVPFVNVANGCATGGSALLSAANAIRAGSCDLAVAVGFDKHESGAFRVSSKGAGLGDWYGATGLALTTQFFGMKINRYCEQYGISHGTLAAVAAKAFRNGSLNPMAWRRKPLTEEEILASPMLSYPLTQYMFCSPGEGAAAVVLCRADIARRYTATPVYLRAATFRTRRFGSFEVLAPWLAVESADGPTIEASRAAFEQAAIGPADCDVLQLQDTESGAEVMHLAECGFCEDGEQEQLIAKGETEIGGQLPVNTDGGCLANGEPVGASGLRQVCESVVQLRGQAGARQVAGSPKTAFTHVYGAPGVSAVTILSR